MKILFMGISGYEFPHVRVRCYKFAEQLRANGVDAEVFSFRDHLAPEISEIEMYRIGDKKKLQLVLKSARRLLNTPDTILYFQKLHYHTAFAHLLTRFLNRPFILDYDDYDVGVDPHGIGMWCGFRRKFLNQLFFGTANDLKILERAAKKALCCISASHSLTEILNPHNKKVFYVPTGVDTTAFTPANPEEKVNRKPFVFLWTGIVWGESIAENLRFVIDTLAIVRQSHPHAILRIAGQGDFIPGVLEYASTKLPESAIDHISWVNPDDMPGILSDAHVGLLPMIRDTNWTRSKSPTKMFEYIASGLPVLASPIGEVNYVLKHGVNGFFAKDQSEFVEAMCSLISDEKRFVDMAHAARETAVNEFSQVILGKRLAKILETLRP